jgi:hypothetical protein
MARATGLFWRVSGGTMASPLGREVAGEVVEQGGVEDLGWLSKKRSRRETNAALAISAGSAARSTHRRRS